MRKIEPIRQTDIFDTSNVGDLPSEIVLSLSHGRGGGKQMGDTSKNILTLMHLAGRPLCVDEILVGLYRQYKITIKRDRLASKLSHHERAGRLRRPSTGMYSIS